MITLTPELLNKIDADWRAVNDDRRTNHDNIHVRGDQVGTITTEVGITAPHNLNRFRFAIDASDRLPQTGTKGFCVKQQLSEKLLEHKQHIDKHGEDRPEVRNWKWSNPQ